ncbi:GPI mannosyltransferase 4 [Harmonia axyridis]|uniref:GPI mannosyltransferase 4 n=1 Tax=Harmonia axyridis TaxID=115357 RepID=UPI001E2757A1|nr:GPI mannosyltransferase 4 [Harmonia axyridis]
MTVSSVLPLALLSLFPHQEPRFLIPLLLPLVYLYGTKILPEKESDVIRADPNSFKSTKVKKISTAFYATWLASNVILTIFYGYLHQGGVVSAMSHLSNVAKRYDRSINIHLFSSHNYMLPQFLLLQHQMILKTEDFISNMEASKKRVHIYEEGSKDLGFVTKKMQIVYNAQKRSFRKFKMFLLIPNSISYDMYGLIGKTNLVLTKIKVFYPHVAIETLPEIGKHYLDLFKVFNYELFFDISSAQVFLGKFIEIFGLSLYEVSEKYISQSDKMISFEKS